MGKECVANDRVCGAHETLVMHLFFSVYLSCHPMRKLIAVILHQWSVSNQCVDDIYIINVNVSMEYLSYQYYNLSHHKPTGSKQRSLQPCQPLSSLSLSLCLSLIGSIALCGKW